MRQFVRDQMCQGYADTSERLNVTPFGLAIKSGRQSEYFVDEDTIWGYPQMHGVIAAPEWVTMAVAAIDIQADRVFPFVLGSGIVDEHPRFAPLAWGEVWYARKDEIVAGIDDEKRVALLDAIQGRLVNEGIVTATGEVLRVHSTLADVGYETDSINKWIKRTPNTYAIRGENYRTKAANATVGTKRVHSYVGSLLVKRQNLEATKNRARTWYYCKTYSVREICHNDMLLDDDQPGAITVPGGLSADCKLVKHWTSWRIVHDEKKQMDDWARKGRDDLDDCLCYSWLFTKYLHERNISTSGPPAPDAARQKQNRRKGGGYLDIHGGMA